jgi:hypothetical protein
MASQPMIMGQPEKDGFRRADGRGPSIELSSIFCPLSSVFRLPSSGFFFGDPSFIDIPKEYAFLSISSRRSSPLDL